jgi:hypothetical protein
MKRADYLALIESYGGNFSVTDFELQGTIDRMDTNFLRSFLAWRDWTNTKTLITSAWRDNDPKSHGKGLAIDCLLFDQWLTNQASPLKHWLFATTWPFQGVGLYFDWQFTHKLTGEKIPAIGLHIDGWSGQRIGERPLRWLRIDGLYYYQSTNSGAFYCKTNKKTITLPEAIRQYNQCYEQSKQYRDLSQQV